MEKRLEVLEKKEGVVGRRLVLMKMVPEGKTGNRIRKYVARLANLTHIDFCPVLASCQL